LKYSEFEREVEKLGFTHNRRCVEIVTKVNGKTVVGISTNREYIVDNEWDEYQNLHKSTQGELFDLAYQLAKTPLAEREEEKIYNVILPLDGEIRQTRYLQRIEAGMTGFKFDNSNYNFVKSNPELYVFTEQEIKDIDERYFLFAEEVKK